MRSARVAIAALVACSACSSSPAPATRTSVSEAPHPGATASAAGASTPSASTHVRGAVLVKAVSLEGKPVVQAQSDLTAGANERLDAVLACLAPLPPSARHFWFVGEVGRDGALGSTMVDSDEPDEIVGCAKKTMADLHVARSGRMALSIYVGVEPAPVDCQGSDCTRIPIVAPSAAKGPADAKNGEGSEESVFGALSGTEVTGDAFGAGGLGLSGSSGVRGEGIGLGSIGTIGHGAGAGAGQGFGNGQGRLGGSHKQPTLRSDPTSLSGRLPPEVIQRIVRQHFEEFRGCYVGGLAKNPKLAGGVKVSFVIGRDGKVSSATGQKSDLPDAGVVACVVKKFSALEFPQPEGGIVRVTYPLKFEPDDGTPAPVLTIGGTSFKQIDSPTLGDKLQRSGWSAVAVGGAEPGDAFVVFAFPKAAKFDPGVDFVTSLTTGEARRPDDRAVESEGVRLVASGAFAEKLLGDLVDANH